MNDEEMLSKIKLFLRGIGDPIRWKLVLSLRREGSLSFTELINQLGKGYSKDRIWLNLEYLIKCGVVTKKKILKKKSKPGRAQVTFYTLTKEGEILIDHLEKAIREIKEAGVLNDSFFIFQPSLSSFL
jgi:DNA-binding transcriptional ArsR family regulator